MSDEVGQTKYYIFSAKLESNTWSCYIPHVLVRLTYKVAYQDLTLDTELHVRPCSTSALIKNHKSCRVFSIDISIVDSAHSLSVINNYLVLNLNTCTRLVIY